MVSCSVSATLLFYFYFVIFFLRWGWGIILLKYIFSLILAVDTRVILLQVWILEIVRFHPQVACYYGIYQRYLLLVIWIINAISLHKFLFSQALNKVRKEVEREESKLSKVCTNLNDPPCLSVIFSFLFWYLKNDTSKVNEYVWVTFNWNYK